MCIMQPMTKHVKVLEIIGLFKELIHLFFVLLFLCPTRKEVDDYFFAAESGTSKKNALSIFKIARKLLLIYDRGDKMVSL